MKLWVDDERPAPEGWTRVESSREAIEVLSGGTPVEALSLDYCLKGSDTGDTVLYWLKDHPDVWPAEVFAHSSSASGSYLLETMIAEFAPKG